MFTPPTTPSAASASTAVSVASATVSTDTTAAKVAKDAVLNANIASICAMEAYNKAAATEASRGKALSLVKSLRRAKTAAMAAAAVSINAASKKGFVETAVSLEKQARGMEALIEEQVAKPPRSGGPRPTKTASSSRPLQWRTPLPQLRLLPLPRCA